MAKFVDPFAGLTNVGALGATRIVPITKSLLSDHVLVPAVFDAFTLQ